MFCRINIHFVGVARVFLVLSVGILAIDFIHISMARFENGPLGGFSGKLGPVVGTTWRGQNVMRSVPRPSTKKFSAAQVLQQQRLKTVQEFIGPMKALLNQTFGSKTGSNPPYNNAMSYHMTDALQQTETGCAIHYPKVLIAKGDLCAIEQPVLHHVAPETLTLNWIDNSNEGLAYPDDQLIVVAYCPHLHYFEYFINTHQRADTFCELILPVAFEGLEIELWASFYNERKQISATSRYLGRVGM